MVPPVLQARVGVGQRVHPAQIQPPEVGALEVIIYPAVAALVPVQG